MRCRQCGEDKPRIPSERRKDRNGFYYRDDKGKLWNGLHCPLCFRKTSYRPAPLFVKVKRFCRRCKDPLPASRYFNHLSCTEVNFGSYGFEEVIF